MIWFGFFLFQIRNLLFCAAITKFPYSQFFKISFYHIFLSSSTIIIINMDQGLISTKLRSVITLVDKLRDINLESYIKLPKIVAVGSQSSGKSSLV